MGMVGICWDMLSEHNFETMIYLWYNQVHMIPSLNMTYAAKETTRGRAPCGWFPNFHKAIGEVPS